MPKKPRRSRGIVPIDREEAMRRYGDCAGSQWAEHIGLEPSSTARRLQLEGRKLEDTVRMAKGGEPQIFATATRARGVIGSMAFSFYLFRTEVSVTDKVPDPSPEIHFPLWFAFLFAGKLLYNFPGQSGVRALIDGAHRLREVVDGERPFAYNGSMLGVLTGSPLRIVPGRAAKAKQFLGELVWKGESLVVETKIAQGDEDYLHRAAIDVALERVRRRLGANGGIVCAAALWYFATLAQRGCSNLVLNLSQGAAAATVAASKIAERS